MYEVGKTYFLNIDDEIYFGKFVGYCSACNTILQFDYRVDSKTKRSVLFTRKEAEVNVLNVV